MQIIPETNTVLRIY